MNQISYLMVWGVALKYEREMTKMTIIILR